eukprot:g7348.t1
MSDTDSTGRSAKKKSFSSRFSSKMEKLSNPFKKGDTSDSDDSDDGSSSHSGKSRSLFGGKLHNPFKKGHSSDSEDEDGHGKSPAKSRKSSSSGKPTSVVSPIKPDPATDPVEAEAAVTASTPSPSAKPPAVAPPGTAAASTAPALPPRTAPAPQAATDPAAQAAPAATPAAAKAPAGTADAALPAQPAGAPAAAAGATAKAAPAPEPKKPRETIGGPVFGAPEILLTGVKGDPDEVMKTLRSRGFVVHLSMLYEELVPPTMTMVLGMGPKLLVKSAVERNLTAKARADYTSGEVAQLCAAAVHVIMRSGVEYAEVNLLHDKTALEGVANAKHKDVPDVVHSYFGPYIGVYFAWLRYYTKALLVPTVGGVFLFVDQMRTGSPDSPLLPIFCILIMVWVAFFLDLWRRRNNEIAFHWGVDGVEDEELMRVQAAREGQFKPSPAGKLCVTVPIILAAIYGVIRAMLYCIWLSDHAIEVYGEDSYLQYYPLVLYSVVPLVAATLYTFLAKALNEFEEHPTTVRKKNALVIKMFVFQFVNSYACLLYVGFWLRDLRRLRQLLMTMMMIKQFIGQLVEKYQPMVMLWLKSRKLKKNPPTEPTYLVKHTGTINPEELAEEMKTEMADVEEDYLEMVLQFGYISMFAVVFPLAPLLAYINNLWEFKLDLSQLVETRRPQSHAESSIGAWQLCLEMVGVVACLTNLLLAVLVSKNVDLYVPTSMVEQLGSFEAKVVLVVVGEHVLFLLKAVLSGLIDKVPKVVREAQLVMAIQQREERKEFRRRASGLPASDRSTTGFQMAEENPAARLRKLNKTHDVWKFGPKWYLPLAFLPYIVAWFNWSALLVLPIAFVFVSYLQHQKDLSDKALALGVVKDPKILELVTGFLPPWYTDSEVERVDWLNKMLDKMWVSASAATEDLFDTTIQPILDSYRPAGVNALGFKKVSLGTIPPKVVGVRALEMKDDKAVIDIDLRWAGNAEFVLEAGVKPVPLLITLNKICFSGRMRVELAPLVPVFPCFGAVVLTFMEKPFIDFKFKLGKLNVMSIGPGDMNVGALVSDTIKNIVTNLMVFPVKMVIPILYEQDILALSNPTPTGVVQLTIVGCDKLRSADIGGKSDPYVSVKLGLQQHMKTDVKSRTLNPRYDETFDLLVYERSVEVMEFEVFDHDSGPSDDDLLGSCQLPLSVLMADVESSHNIPLSNTKTGSLLLKATFVPLSSGKQRVAPVDEDVLVNVASGDITDDVVAADTYTNLSADGQPIKVASEPKPSKKGPAVDPSTLTPHAVTPSDTSMGVITVMGIECKGVKPGERYVSVICGNHKRKTAVIEGMSEFACPEVFNFLIRGAKAAVVEFLLKEKEMIGSDKCLGSFQVKVAEVMANDDQLDGEWDLTGEKAQGSIKLRLKWSGRAGEGA